MRKVGSEIMGAIPLGGTFLHRLLRGGDAVTGATLTRFYDIPIAVLPALTALLLSLHLFLVQQHGMRVPPSVERRGGGTRRMPFLPNFLLRDLLGWLSALAVLAALAAYLPAELGQKADPFAPAPAEIKPEWYFMFMFQTLKYLPGEILGIEGEIAGVLGFGLGGLFLLLIPFLDRRTALGEPSPLFTWIGILLLLSMVVLTYLRYTVSPTT